MKKLFFYFFMTFVMLGMYSCKKETQLEKDLDVIKDFLSENGISAKKQQNVYYVITEEGTGAQPEPGQRVACLYKLYSMSNPEVLIDEATTRAYELTLPPTVPNSSYGTIAGFQIACTILHEGGTGIFYVPSALAYGQNPPAESGLEADANLIFEIKLCEILSNDNKH